MTFPYGLCLRKAVCHARRVFTERYERNAALKIRWMIIAQCDRYEAADDLSEEARCLP